MSFAPGNYLGFTAADYAVLQGLAQGNDELTEFLADNFTSVAGGAFYIMDADPSNGTDVDLLEMLEELDTSGFTIGLTSFHYLKSTWAMGGM